MSMNQKPSHIMLRWIWLIVLIVLLDQGTKHLVVSSLEPNRPIAVLPAVEFVLSYNTGVSFSFFRFVDNAQRWPLVGLSILASETIGLVAQSRTVWQADLGNGACPDPWWSVWQHAGPRSNRFSNRLRSCLLQSVVVRRVQFRRRGHHDRRRRHHSVNLSGDA